jgi:hypothetical protein
MDAAGNLYMTGFFSGDADFGGNTFTSNGGKDIFVSKLDPAGNWLWTKTAGGAGDDEGVGICAGSGAYLHVVGNFCSQQLLIGNATLGNAGDSDIFYARISSNGGWSRARRAGGPHEDSAHAVCVDSYGNPCVVGEFLGTTSFGEYPPSPVPEFTTFSWPGLMLTPGNGCSPTREALTIAVTHTALPPPKGVLCLSGAG